MNEMIENKNKDNDTFITYDYDKKKVLRFSKRTNFLIEAFVKNGGNTYVTAESFNKEFKRKWTPMMVWRFWRLTDVANEINRRVEKKAKAEGVDSETLIGEMYEIARQDKEVNVTTVQLYGLLAKAKGLIGGDRGNVQVNNVIDFKQADGT